VQIDIREGWSDEQKRTLVKGITNLVHEVGWVPIERVHVAICEGHGLHFALAESTCRKSSRGRLNSLDMRLMRPLRLKSRTIVALALLVAGTGLLAGCETTGTSTEAAKPVEPPMTRSRAATECWMKTEKGSASADLDKRADVVSKCIDEKMKAAPKT